MYRTITAAIALALAIVTHLPQTKAAILYNTPASSYSQSFDTLPNAPTNVSLGNSPVGWTDDNAAPGVGNFSIVGFYLRHPLGPLAEGGANGRQRMRIGAGTVNTGAFMSFGDAASTERALGVVNSNTLSNAPPNPANNTNLIGARFTNNTSMILREFTVSYNGEQWRDGGAATPAAQKLEFDYSFNATTIEDIAATFVDVNSLDFTSPVFANTGAGAAVNGNVAGRTAIGPVTVSQVYWAPGTDLWIRWREANDPGNEHGLGIDDLRFSADIPEPGSIVLMFSAAIALLGYRRYC